jgi:hypothetical protein
MVQSTKRINKLEFKIRRAQALMQLQQQTKNLEKKDEYDEWHKRNFDIG